MFSPTVILFSLFLFRSLLSAHSVDCDAYDCDVSYGFFIARKATEDGLWLGLVLAYEEFEEQNRAPLRSFLEPPLSRRVNPP